jgi:hypothetical protein
MPDNVIVSSVVQITTTLPISQYVGYFTPPVIDVPRAAEITYTFDFMRWFTSSAPVSAWTVDFMINHVVMEYWIGLRIAMSGLAFVISFVMSRIRKGKQFANDVVVNVKRRVRW